jgi:hypothetical protein
LEGPEAGVYYRGTSFLDPAEKYREIALPAYADALATEFTVHVTPVIMGDEFDDDFSCVNKPMLVSSRVIKGKFRVYMNNKTEATTSCAFDYLVFGKRLEIKVEPLKTEVTVNRFGPYTWLDETPPNKV